MGVVVFAAAVATVLTYVGNSDEASGGTGSPAPSSILSPPPAEAHASEPVHDTAPAVGSCLDSGDAPAPCDGPHAAEVFATGDCSETALLTYLGGQSGQDVLRELSTASLPTGDTVVCTVTAPEGALAGGSHRDVLLSDAGDAWRRCVDHVEREVGCAQPHVAEVVFDRRDTADPLDCARRADDYLGTPFATKSADLRVLQDEQRCLLAVRGDNILTGSLRRLGSQSLPLQAAPS
ncbi:hypothetical protein BD833_107164 [Blastococcus xanthinilyticus]|uniref:Uncharacterized protein n=2 Tax=Blastococcus xanthinilyticus TaxID=1564164 RepID=A0A5S5CVV7_9ACTN|nr:hypothetical protein BD833_107164 [Blastococcus xanthinilyticus]